MSDPERRLHGAADGFEPDRDAIWRQINLGIDAPRPVRRRGPYVWPLSVAAAAALVILGINVLDRGGPPPGGVTAAPVAAPLAFSDPASPGSTIVPSAKASATASVHPVAPSSTPAAGHSPAAPSTGPSAPAAARVTISVVRAPVGLAVTLPLTAGRPWFAAAPVGANSAGGPVSAGFGVGPLQVNGVSSVTATSPFKLSWAGGSPTATGASNSGWSVLSASVASGQASLRVPLRPLGPPGTFKVYLATLGGGAHVSVSGLGPVVDQDIRDCGAAICPVVVTIAVSGAQRGDGSLDLTPTGGGGVGIAAAAQQS